MNNYINFLLGSALTYIGLLASNSQNSINALPPEAWELFKIIVSGVFGILTTIVLNYFKKRWKINDDQINNKLRKEKNQTPKQ